jgi:hypothetical protein
VARIDHQEVAAMFRRLVVTTAVLALATIGAAVAMLASASPASASVSGNCAAPAYTPSYPAYQELDFGTDKPWGPIYIFENAEMVKYHDANGNENFYGMYLAWVNINNVYQSSFNWPPTFGRPGFTSYAPVPLGTYIFVAIPIQQTYNIGGCTIGPMVGRMVGGDVAVAVDVDRPVAEQVREARRDRLGIVGG